MEVILDGHPFLIDENDWDRLKSKPWRAQISHQGRFVVVRQVGCSAARTIRNIYIQHEIVGDIPRGMVIDHINRNPADNRRCNLRVCTRAQNNCNRGPDRRNRIGFKGVVKAKNRYQARIGRGVQGRSIYIGSFLTAEDAARAYDTAARRLQGEFAWLNTNHHPHLTQQKVRDHGA